MKISREFKTGFFAVAIIALFIWGFNFLKGRNIFEGSVRVFKTEYADVQGLSKSSEVTINGVNVGKVTDIQFSKEKKGNLIVYFNVENDFQFSKNSVAKIYSASLMGGKSLAIIPSFEGETAKSGDFLKGDVESDIFSSVSEKINPLQVKVVSLINNIDSVMVNINKVLDAKTRANLQNSIANLNQTIVQVNTTTKSVNDLIKNNEEKINKSLSNTEHITKNLADISEGLSKKDLGATVTKVENTLTQINTLLASIQQGKGTLGKLMNDDTMYINLTNASKELEELLRDFKLHPKRFVHFSLFGKKNKEYRPEK